MKLIKKTILITGSNQGLGKELAIQLSELGAKIILLARTESLLKQTKDQIGKNAMYYVCDITDENEVSTTIEKITEKHNQIDILINNAGVWTDNNIEKENSSQRLKAIETNVFGQIQITESLLPTLKNQEQAIIFNVISSAAVPDIPAGDNTLWKTYGASKWGFTGYVQALRESLRKTNVKVIQFFPGGFESNLYENADRDNPHHQPWMMETNDVADIVVFALTRPKDVYMEKIVVTKKM